MSGMLTPRTPSDKPWLKAIAAAVLLSSLSACGGGGSDSDDDVTDLPTQPQDPVLPNPGPNAPVLALTISGLKQITLDWNDVEGEFDYRLYEYLPSRPLVSPDLTAASADRIQRALLPADTTSKSLEIYLPDRTTAWYTVRACNDLGCNESAPVYINSDLAEAVGYFKAANPDINDHFGTALDIAYDGKTLAVGVPHDDSSGTGINPSHDNLAADSGAVYIFSKVDGQWTQTAYIKPANTEAGDMFGSAVAISDEGNYLVVGAPGEDSDGTSDTNNSMPSSGAAYVFFRDEDGAWSQRDYLKATHPSTGGAGLGLEDQFGAAVDITAHGEYIVVGSPNEDSDGAGIGVSDANDNLIDSGAAYIFSGASLNWQIHTIIKDASPEANDRFGHRVALAGYSGSHPTLAITSQNDSSAATGVNGDHTDTSIIEAGSVFLYTAQMKPDFTTEWQQKGYFKASNPDAHDQFGHSIALSRSGLMLAVGSVEEASRATGLNGDQSDNSGLKNGAVYVFEAEGLDYTWRQTAYLKGSVAGDENMFGASLAFGKDEISIIDLLYVGAPGESSGSKGSDGEQTNSDAFQSGAVYTFRRHDYWTQANYIKAPNPGVSDRFGEQLSATAYPSVLIVGAAQEDGDSTGVTVGADLANDSATEAGAVYMY